MNLTSIVIKGFFTIILSMTAISAHSTNNSWYFDVFLNDKQIGEHSFIVKQVGNVEQVDISATFDVKILFFTAYKYRHTNTEIWQGECLQNISSSTDDNGKNFKIDGKQVNDEQGNSDFVLTINDKRDNIKGCVNTFSYWNKAILTQTSLLNAQTGEYQAVKIDTLPSEDIIINNRLILASRHRLQTDKFAIELWYSPDGKWLALRSTNENGKILTYKLKKELL